MGIIRGLAQYCHWVTWLVTKRLRWTPDHEKVGETDLLVLEGA